MKIQYTKTDFTLKFAAPIQWQVLPTFFLRSILGAQLKKTCCVQRQSSCDTCLLKTSCAYSILFESPLDETAPVLQGRNRAYHPFILTHGAVLAGTTEYRFTLTLVGKGIQFFPFVVFAFRQAGEEGIFSSKIPYQIAQISDHATGKNLFGTNIKPPLVQMFQLNPELEIEENIVSIEFLTPARIKHLGSYTLDFDARTFLSNIYRRFTSLVCLYEETEPTKSSIDLTYPASDQIQITSRQLRWRDFSRYSHRQGSEMELGGAEGKFELTGGLRALDLSLLEAGSLFHVGKNTVFGLGQIIYRKHSNVENE